MYPNAKYYGTPRHLRKQPEIPWVGAINDVQFKDTLYPSELSFAITPCCDFEDPNFEGHHVMSVLAFHHKSRTLHNDDTFTYFSNVPWPLTWLGVKKDDLKFNFQLKPILKASKTPNAMTVYRAWYRHEVLDKWSIENACLAHDGVLVGGAQEKFEGLMSFFDK